MKNILEHIEHIKAQPYHVRKRVTFASAGTITAIIALIWFVGSVSTGAFSLQDNSFVADSGQTVVTADTYVSDESVSGTAAVGASSVLQQSSDSTARIEIVDAMPKPQVQKQAEQTIIPF